MSIIPLHLQRRIEQRWAARFAGKSGRAEENRIEKRDAQHTLGPASAKESHSQLSEKAQGR